MDSVDKLRWWAKRFGPMGSHDPLMFADEIEAEIERNYMRLPVDADGVPIHVGDELCGYGLPNGGAVVKALNSCMVIVGRLDGGENYAKSGLLWDARETHHVKPRTLEDVLLEFGNRVCNSGHQWGLDAADVVPQFADEIRELMGGDAE